MENIVLLVIALVGLGAALTGFAQSKTFRKTVASLLIRKGEMVVPNSRIRPYVAVLTFVGNVTAMTSLVYILLVFIFGLPN